MDRDAVWLEQPTDLSRLPWSCCQHALLHDIYLKQSSLKTNKPQFVLMSMISLSPPSPVSGWVAPAAPAGFLLARRVPACGDFLVAACAP